MATRCNLIITAPGFRVYLYRHYDGYPAIGGSSIARAIRSRGLHHDPVSLTHGDLGDFARSLIETGEWEMTDGVHGDIDWLYRVDAMDKTRIRVAVWNKAGPRFSTVMERAPVAAFREFVADQCRRMLGRIRELRLRRARSA